MSNFAQYMPPHPMLLCPMHELPRPVLLTLEYCEGVEGWDGGYLKWKCAAGCEVTVRNRDDVIRYAELMRTSIRI